MSLPEKPEENSSEDSFILFRDLKEDSKPLFPLPIDECTVTYKQHYQGKCTLCTSPWRERAEHVYLESGKKPQSVINFFKEFFKAKLNFVQVKTHMEEHCNFQDVSISGLMSYERQEDVMGRWKFKEEELALTALLVELDETRGLNISNKNPELKLKKTAMVEKLTTKILDVKKHRDDSALHAINIFEILQELMNAMQYPEDKQILREKVREIRLKMSKEE